MAPAEDRISVLELLVSSQLGGGPAHVEALISRLDRAEFARIEGYGFVSGSSTHADRLATIRDTWRRFGVMIDTHTADGLKVARAHVEPGVPTIVLETALPAKFADAIVEAIGRHPDRPAAMLGIEQLPKRFTVMRVDAQAVKDFIAENA